MAPKKIALTIALLVGGCWSRLGSGRRSPPRYAVHQDRPDDPIEYRAKTFVVASGYCWSSHLLLLSTSSRFPNGLANSSGLVGRYMNGHRFMQATANIDDQTFPGQNMTHSLISREYFRCPADKPFVRHDTRVWESSAGAIRGCARGRQAADRRGAAGRLAVADEGQLGAAARLRRRPPVSRQPADARRVEEEPLRRSDAEDRASLRRSDAVARGGDEGARARRVRTLAEGEQRPHRQHSEGDYLDHPAGGCRMGTDPRPASATATAGPTITRTCSSSARRRLPTGGCTNGTLTFVALTLRSAEAIAKS
jgi:quinoprotein glucose dehydrogenase